MAKKAIVQNKGVRALAGMGASKVVELRDGKVLHDADAALLQAVPELLAVRDDSMTIREWMGTLVPFFTTAKQLEVEAHATLADARLLVLPTNGAEDTRVQTFIRQASADMKKAESHWQVTALVFNFQRRLVTVRKRTTDTLEEAAKLAQGLHNRYVENERRRVEEENRKRQREADDKAAAERQAELDRIEAAALRAEAGDADLSERERAFVDYYLAGLAATSTPERAAALKAGFKDPAGAAARLMKTAKILGAIDNAKTAKALREQAAAKREVPVQPAEIQEARPDVGGGGSDRTTKSMEIFDEAALIQAVIDGKHGIPTDLLMVNPVKGNDLARQFGTVINRWPGCRLKTRTTTV